MVQGGIADDSIYLANWCNCKSISILTKGHIAKNQDICRIIRIIGIFLFILEKHRENNLEKANINMIGHSRIMKAAQKKITEFENLRSGPILDR